MKKQTTERTTIRFESSIREVVDYFAAIYGLKNLVSAGVYLFGQLSDSEQKEVIMKIKQVSPNVQAAVDDILSALAQTKKKRNPVVSGQFPAKTTRVVG